MGQIRSPLRTTCTSLLITPHPVQREYWRWWWLWEARCQSYDCAAEEREKGSASTEPVGWPGWLLS